MREVITKYDFQPSAVAQALSETKTRQIGMVVADALNPYYNTLYTAFDQVATQNGYMTLLVNNRSRPGNDGAVLASLVAQRTDAIVIFGGLADLCEPDSAYTELITRLGAQVPLILGSKMYDEHFSSVSVDHKHSMDLALEHLISLGHRDIGFIYAGERFYGTRDKLLRFRKIMERRGLPVREEWLIEVPKYNAPSGQEGIDRLMQLPNHPTALVAINDTVAAGMLQALNRHGVRVPEEMSIIGFDNIFLTNLTTPTLSAVGYDYEEMARIMFETTIQAIEGKERQNHLIPPFLSARASTSPPQKQHDIGR